MEVKAHELIGPYVGQTVPIVQAKMDEARGAVLFIDEAYGLDHSRERGGSDSFKKEALEALLGNMTDPAYAGNMVIILAGYRDQLTSLLACNPGLPRRFPEMLEFRAWEPRHCVELVQRQLSKEGIELPLALHAQLDAGFTQLARLPAYGSAGDAVTVAAKMQRAWERRFPDGDVPVSSGGSGSSSESGGAGAGGSGDAAPASSAGTVTDSAGAAALRLAGPVIAADIDEAFADMLQQRRRVAAAAVTAASLDAEEDAELEPPAMRVAGGPSEAPAAVSRSAVALTNASAETAAETAAARTGPAATSAGNSKGGDGGAPAAGAEQTATAEAEVRAGGPSPDEILASLEQALVACGYDVEASLAIVASRDFPDALLRLVAEATGGTPASVRPHLVAQCPALQPRLEAAAAQLRQQREAEEAIARATAAAEREALRLAEIERRRLGAYICAACGRAGCPVRPVWHSWREGEAGPPLPYYNGNNGPAFSGPPPAM